MDGVLIVNKEAGWTSHDVVAKVRHLLGGTKVGHAGTLDPAATGLLPLLIGKGTRIAEYLLEWDKEYHAVLRLGETTDTQDATGTVVDRQAVDQITPAAIREAVERFRGVIEQVPPMYSAVKVAGVPLYKSARAGKTIAREARTVVIHELEILAIDGRDVTLRVVCSKGTYIRTLCADIGVALGVGGYLYTLERNRVGPLTLDRALTVDTIATRQALGCLGEDLLSLDWVLQDFPALVVDEQTASRVRHGVPVPLCRIIRRKTGQENAQKSPARMPVRIHDDSGRLLAIGRLLSEQHDTITIEKVLTRQE
ncbi:MAG TPA: tRNA pseudouridine(55) synthase TruB [Nitrospira sp.]|nr:tRNA pseudouridine(55) synthase TruB [Nitrospira sp.]